MNHFNNAALILNSSSSSSEDEEPIILRRTKIYRKREDCFNKYDEIDFFDRFRSTKCTVLTLQENIQHLIELPTRKGGCIQPMAQFLLPLRFFATGNMLIIAGDFSGVSKSSACRIVRRVSSAIASLRAEYINMYDEADMKEAAEDFYRISKFPRVIGAIDCTFIKIESPGGDDAEIFRCRKGFFALILQTVADSNLKIRNIVAHWPGSTHDQTIFNNCILKQEFDNQRFGTYLLVGDSGYSIEPYLMTKLPQTQTSAENLYNESLIRTRNVVDRSYGVWKKRFPILSLGLRLKLETVMCVIVATAVLHNIAIDMHEIIPEEWFEDIEDMEEIEIENINEGGGRNTRRIIINEHSARL